MAERPFGVFSRQQVLAVGGTDGLIHRRTRASRWDRLASGVYGFPGGRASHFRELWIAHLAIGAHSTVSHEAAGGLHGLTGFPRGPLTFTVPHSGHQHLRGVVAHQISDLTDADRTTILGLPTTRIARTFVDLAAVARRSRLETALDDALLARKTTCSTVGQVLRSVARPGKPGIGLLARILDDRGPGYVPPASVLERAFFAAIADAGLPAPTRQHPLPGVGALEGLVDAAYPTARLLIEVDGRRWHGQLRQMAKDRARDQQAASAGWLTLRFTYEQVTQFPEEVARVVRATLARRTTELSTQ